jgi:signal transduction histidine kinase
LLFPLYQIFTFWQVPPVRYLKRVLVPFLFLYFFYSSAFAKDWNYQTILKEKEVAFLAKNQTVDTKMATGLAYLDWLNFEKQSAAQPVLVTLRELSLENDSLRFEDVTYQNALYKYNFGKYEEALQEVWTGMNFCIRKKDTSESYVNLGILASKCKNVLSIYNSSIADAIEMQKIAKREGLLYQEYRALRMEAISFGMTGDINGTVSRFQRALAIAVKLNDKPYEYMIKAEIGAIYSRNKDKVSNDLFQQGKSLLLEAHLFFKANNYSDKLVSTYEELGNWYFFNYELDKAEIYLSNALKTMTMPVHERYWATCMIELALVKGEFKQFDSAIRNLDTTIKFTKERKFFYLTVRSLRIKHGILYKQGRFEDAYKTSLDFIEENSKLAEFKGGLSKTANEQSFASYLLKDQLKIADSQVKEKNKRLLVLSVMGVFLGIAIVILMLLQIKIKQTNNKLQANNELMNELNSRLSLSDETKNKLFRIISHDLKGPLGANLMAIRLMADAVQSGDQGMVKHLVEMLGKSNTALLEMLDTLLNWSATQMNSTKVYNETFELQSVISQVKRQYLDQIQSKRLVIDERIQGLTVLYTDKNLLMIVLRNILSNAFKFSPMYATVTVMGEIRNGKPCICVIDNGIGIPKDMLPKLFTMDTSKNRKGTAGETTNGFGMMMVKDIALFLGAEILVESEVGKGTTFTVQLPISALPEGGIG